jgi:hypothetical protein
MVFLALLALAATLPAADVLAQSAADVAMSQRIGNVLKESGRLRNYRIGVKFQDGVARLSGTVTDPQQAADAVRLAGGIPGVMRVSNELDYPDGQRLPSGGSTDEMRHAFRQVDMNRSSRGADGVVQAFANARPITGNQHWPAAARAGQTAARRPMPRNNMPRPMHHMANGGPPIRQVSNAGVYQAGGACPPGGAGMMGGPGMGGGMGDAGMSAVPVGFVPHGSGRGPSYDNAQMPGYAWPSYASYPNYGALTYPQQYSPTAWPYIGPFYPYPQVPLAWRKVSLEWDDGWWFLDFSAHNSSH